MRKLIIAAACLALSSVNADTLTIGLDLSGSNPLTVHPNFAYMAANHVHGEILKLKEGDTVNFRVFGSIGVPDNILSQPILITRKNSARKVAKHIAAYIQSIPGGKEPQGSTNILAFLELGSGFDCENGGRLVLVTDAIESSELVDAGALLEGKTGLPSADVNLDGCSMYFYGLGAGRSIASIKYLRKEWIRWAKEAGVTFDFHIPI